MPETPARATIFVAALSVLLVWVVATLAVFVSMIYPLGIPGCDPDWPSCDIPPIGLAWAVTWGSTAAGVGASFGDIARHHRIRIAGQLCCTGVIVFGAVLGFMLMST